MLHCVLRKKIAECRLLLQGYTTSKDWGQGGQYLQYWASELKFLGLPMETTVTCRDIPLLCVPQGEGGGGGSEEGEQKLVPVHQLSSQLWQKFQTPRPSVQKKIEELKIRLIQCSRSQVEQLRRSGIIGGFRATLITLQDAERLYDQLRLSREKRGLLKHSRLKRRKNIPRKGKMNLRRCGGLHPQADPAQESPVKNHPRCGGQAVVVDGCAPFGNAPPPTPLSAASAAASPLIRTTPPSSQPHHPTCSPISTCLSLPGSTYLLARDHLSPGSRHEGPAAIAVDDFDANFCHHEFTDASRKWIGGELDALDLCSSEGMAAMLRSHLSAKEKPESSKGKVGRPRSRHFSHSPARGSRHGNGTSSHHHHQQQQQQQQPLGYLPYLLDAPPTGGKLPGTSLQPNQKAGRGKYPVSGQVLANKVQQRSPILENGLEETLSQPTKRIIAKSATHHRSLLDQQSKRTVVLERLHHPCRRSERVPSSSKPPPGSPQMGGGGGDPLPAVKGTETTKKLSNADPHRFRRTPSTSRDRLSSPVLENDIDERSSPQENGLGGGGEAVKKSGGGSERPHLRRSDRFLFLSSEEEEDVVVMKVEKKKTDEQRANERSSNQDINAEGKEKRKST